jgi:hypothetical protein
VQFNKKQDKPQEDRAMSKSLKDNDSNAHHDFAYTMFAATRSIRRSLIKFIRMTDYMLGSALRSVLMSSCKAVVDTLVQRNCSPALPEAVCCYHAILHSKTTTVLWLQTAHKIRSLAVNRRQ